MDTLGGTQQLTVINEPGPYEVIIRSDKPEAKAFRRWVTSEVLKAGTINSYFRKGMLPEPYIYYLTYEGERPGWSINTVEHWLNNLRFHEGEQQ